MLLQRQRFLLSLLNTPSVRPTRVWTGDLPHGSPSLVFHKLVSYVHNNFLEMLAPRLNFIMKSCYSILFQTQTILSLLAEVDFIHIIASIDHINAPLSK